VVVPWAVIGATIAEWLGAPAGLGICSKNGMAELDAAALLAPLVVLTVVALLLNKLVGLIERPVLRHRD
jgi:putative hydroxymethylpyrimidine transport system permease protein